MPCAVSCLTFWRAISTDMAKGACHLYRCGATVQLELPLVPSQDVALVMSSQFCNQQAETNGRIPGRFIFQIDEMVNVAAPARLRSGDC